VRGSTPLHHVLCGRKKFVEIISSETL